MKLYLNETETKTLNPINQVKAMETLSPRYGFVNTESVLAEFEAKGWKVDRTQVANTRIDAKQGFQRHLIHLVNQNLPTINLSGDDVRPELVLMNSHDGTTSLRIFLGLLRFACLNGIIAGASFRNFRAVHSQGIVNKLGQGIGYMADGVPEMLSTIERLSKAQFSDAGLNAFIKDVVDKYFETRHNVLRINYDDAIRIRRYDDKGESAWHMFNRIQEAIVRGGIKYDYTREIKDDNGVVLETQVASRKTSTLRSIPRIVSLNQYVLESALKYVA